MKFNHALIVVGVGLLSLVSVVSSCKKPDEDPAASYDTAPMLTNVGNNIIIPSYQKFVNSINSLDSAIAVFNATPSSTTLTNLQTVYKDACRAWQYCSLFEFGPAKTQSMTFLIVNTFPTDKVQIENNVTSGSYNLAAGVNSAAIGLPALDYLLFGIDNTTLLTQFTTGANADHRRQLLVDLTTDIKTRATNTLNQWLPSGGNYIGDFVSNTGTDAASSISLLLNAYITDYELLKNKKLALPITTHLPEIVEGYYCGISSELALTQMKVSRDLYLGKAGAVDGKGFEDILIQIDARRQLDGKPLDSLIKAQYNVAINALQAVPDPLSTAVSSSSAALTTASAEAQKLVPLIKRETAASMGILLNVDDENDGD
jgi:predicted lipoprotein